MKHVGGGHPRKYSDDEIKVLVKKFEQYIDETDIPIIAEFSYKNDILRESLYDYNEFATLLKKCIAKKETQLERKCLNDEVVASMAIFSLKQLGWRDKHDVEHSGSIENKYRKMSDEELENELKKFE